MANSLDPSAVGEIETGLAASEEDRRWQAAVRLGEFVRTEPRLVWPLAARWGCSDDPDVRMAIATCVLEHLLEYGFKEFFPQVEQLALADERFASTFQSCWQFRQSEEPANAARMTALNERLRGKGAA